MNSQTRLAALSGLCGAVAAIIVIYGGSALGILPANGPAVQRYMLAHPELLVAMTNELQQQQDAEENHASQQAVDKLGLKAFFNPHIAYITGPENAKTTFVEMFDYNCPYCRASLPYIKKFYAQHKNDARFAFIEFPIKGPDSVFAARAALAARKQGDKYLALHFALMSEADHVDAKTILADAQKVGIDMNKLQTDMNAPDVNTGINESLALAKAARVDGTPFFVVNGKIRPGALDADTLQDMAKG
ncbi:MAG TPA: DsbA family protein [Rhizomicrobium sp.]|nr:DsbA family protein [Rhizomicrobium sp.]